MAEKERYSFEVDPENSAKIRAWEARERARLERTVLSEPQPHSDDPLSDKEKRSLIRLAKIAILSKPKSYEKRLRIIEILGRGGYAICSNYLQLSPIKQKDYFENDVIPSIGLQAGRYCYNDYQKILTEASRNDSQIR